MLFDFLGLYPYYGHKILTWVRLVAVIGNISRERPSDNYPKPT